jgi:ElaB/YqjD/DUF883 family membrane-anchored ribosome-binding protein
MAAPINRLESIWSRREAREAALADEQLFPTRRASSRIKSLENSVEGLLAQHPKAAIVAAAAVGIALGWIVKRK